MSIVVDAIALYNIDDRDDYTLALTQKLNELGIKEETKWYDSNHRLKCLSLFDNHHKIRLYRCYVYNKFIFY